MKRLAPSRQKFPTSHNDKSEKFLNHCLVHRLMSSEFPLPRKLYDKWSTFPRMDAMEVDEGAGVGADAVGVAQVDTSRYSVCCGRELDGTRSRNIAYSSLSENWRHLLSILSCVEGLSTGLMIARPFSQ